MRSCWSGSIREVKSRRKRWVEHDARMVDREREMFIDGCGGGT